MQSTPLRVAVLVLCATPLLAQTLPRAEWGAPLVAISHSNGKWLIAGRTNRVTLDEKDLSLAVQNGDAHWAMVPSATNDMSVKARGAEFPLRLADAGTISI